MYLKCPCMIHFSLSHPICRWLEDGSLVGEDGSFTNWDYLQPSGYNDCMAMVTYIGKWMDAYCGNTVSAICSKSIATAAHNITRA